tara:strand:+ start:23 stop:451 length:429 start_codon:yes stop_codon:yes gene_type:complete
MKKLSLYVFLGLFIFNSGYAEVYYCTDGAITGFNSKKDNYGTYSEDSVYFTPKRFTANINFEKFQFGTKDIVGFLQIQRDDGTEYFASTCEGGGYAGEKMSCVGSSTTQLITIEKDSLKYVRSSNYGGGDSIFIAYGKCEKF